MGKASDVRGQKDNEVGVENEKKTTKKTSQTETARAFVFLARSLSAALLLCQEIDGVSRVDSARQSREKTHGTGGRYAIAALPRKKPAA